MKLSDIRVQWDPERDIDGKPLQERSIQIGIGGEYVQKYVHEWIENITDVTDYVYHLKSLVDGGKDITNLLPAEKSYQVTDMTG